MSSRDSSTHISLNFPPSGKIKPLCHCLAICALPWPRPGLVFSIPRNPLLSHTAESSLQIELVAPGQAWPQPSISASELPSQHHEAEFNLTHKANFSYTPSPKSEFLSENESIRDAKNMPASLIQYEISRQEHSCLVCQFAQQYYMKRRQL